MAKSAIAEKNNNPVAPEKPIVESVSIPTLPTELKIVTAAEIVDSDKDLFSGTPKELFPMAEENNKSNDDTEVIPPKRGRGRPPGTKNKKTESASEESFVPSSASEAPKQSVNYDAMATALFHMGTGTLAQVLGPEWLPREPGPGIPGEVEIIVPAIKRYIESKQMSDLPPGMMLTVVLIAYAAPRFSAPNTKQKVQGTWLWLKSKFGRKKKMEIVKSPVARNEENTTEETK